MKRDFFKFFACDACCFIRIAVIVISCFFVASQDHTFLTMQTCAEINATNLATCLETEGVRQITFGNETRLKLYISSSSPEDTGEEQHTYTITCQSPGSELRALVENLPNITLGAQSDVIIDGCLPFDDLLAQLDTPSTAVAKIQGGVESSTLTREHMQSLRDITLLAVSAFAQLEVDTFADLENLTSLEFTRFSGVLPSQLLHPLQQLKYLWLRESKLEQVPIGLFEGLEQLESIDLSYNDLRVISDDTFADQKQLLSLDLSNNQLTHLPRNAFQSLKKLTQLRIFNNHLQRLPLGIFRNLGNLRYLELDNNELDIPEQEDCNIFEGLDSLEYLELSNNSLTNLCFNMNLTFVSIKVPHNRISTLRVQSGDLPQKLLHLNARHNQLRRLSGGVIQYLYDTGAELELAHNPWQCDREADQWLVFLQLQRRKVRDIEEVRCAGDALKKITDFAVCDICQATTLQVVSLAALVGVSALAVTLLIATILYRHKAIRALQRPSDDFVDVKLQEKKNCGG